MFFNLNLIYGKVLFHAVVIDHWCLVTSSFYQQGCNDYWYPC